MNRDTNDAGTVNFNCAGVARARVLAALFLGVALASATACSSAGNPGSGDDNGSPGTPDVGRSTRDGGRESAESSAPSGDDSTGGYSTGTDSGSTDVDAAPDTDSGVSPSAEAGAVACPVSGIKPSEVVMIGDSYLDDNWTFTGADIMDLARKAGKLAKGDSYRHYYVGGTQMVGGLIGPPIPTQYENAKAADKNIKVVIMDGGGNDILIGDRSCLTAAPPGNAGCTTTLQGVFDQAKKTIAEMAADGVQAIVYMFYSHLDPAGGGLLPAPAPGMNPTLDYAVPLAKAICSPTGAVPCYFIDNSHLFENQWTTLLKPDHIHPLPPGAQMLAEGVWKTMQDHCIAQ